MRRLVTLRLIKGDRNCQESSAHGGRLWHVLLRHYSSGYGVEGLRASRGKNSLVFRTEIDTRAVLVKLLWDGCEAKFENVELS